MRNLTPALQNRLAASDGPIEGCRAAMTALEKLFPKQSLQNGQNASKRQKVQATFATLALPLKQGQVQYLLQQISRHRDGIQLALTTEVTKDIKDIKAASEEIRSILTGEQRHRVYNWLTSTDPSPIHNRSRKLYEHGTGSWMLRSQHWTDWLASSTQCLWVRGIPGCGKTILASWLIGNVQDHCERVSIENSPCTSAYYYCYFGHHQDEAAPFLRWVITQLSRQAEVVPTLMHNLFKRGGEPSIYELLDALEQILQVFSCVYVVIDAVDESNPRDELLEVIHTFVTDQKFSNLQILVTSREYIDIERVMEKVSVSVPMSNELVAEDIRLHVQSILRSNPKFRCWPDDLLIEVEDAVSTQAEGMFRWAVCQLHELQRLKGERNVVSNALERLPKDLDETYDRIFLRIPQEDWQFVSHAFQWLWFYGELGPPYNGTPSVLLLDAIESSTSRTGNRDNHVHYNSERLRELCGCLIGSLEDSISFAHYTVKEYLDSARICQGPLIVFSTERTKVMSTCLDVLLLQAQTVASQHLKDVEANHHLRFDDLWKNLSFHSFFYARTSLKIWGQEISKSDEIYMRVKKLLCPSTQYLRCLGKLAFNEAEDIDQWYDLLEETEFFGTLAWTIDWNEHLTDSDASLFLSLFLFASNIESPLLCRLIREADLKTILSNRIVLKKDGNFYTHSMNGQRYERHEITETYEFDGPLVEVMVQFLPQETEHFHSLLANHNGLYNPSTTLIYFIGHHRYDPLDDDLMYNRPHFCPLRHLLEVGAQPNLSGYPLTPLQIAVAARNLEGVRLLLHFRADPNCIGDPLSNAWPANSLIAEFKGFYGMSPLRICRSGGWMSLAGDLGGESMTSSMETIQYLLLAYGGRDFQRESSEPLTA
ncbi:Vegetative incompatibility protein HET-E-1 [Fusarium oxysporum f. sp. rapae]|uniref:Vegetative incompatibility protein HET-E-1 n=1 Tax=Fusarium oxysporum f. sp. rapae TaxID=485398 RepID=A0A8J5U4I8_FUSOX|nr:Vegetative incompatibility protein HET-E-1 [Fusarium oxysporum f. sp. rapae]